MVVDDDPPPHAESPTDKATAAASTVSLFPGESEWRVLMAGYEHWDSELSLGGGIVLRLRGR